MKVAYVTATQIPAPNAQSVQIMAMAQAFAKLSDFTLISPATELNLNQSTGSFEWRRVNTWFNSRALKSLALVFGSIRSFGRFEVILTRDILIAFLMVILGRRVVYEIHKPFNTRLGYLLFSLVRRKISIISISAALKRKVIELYGIDANRILVAHDGVAVEKFDNIKESKVELKRRLGILGDRFVVMYCGSLYPGRGVEIVLECALKQPQYLFVLVGGTQQELTRVNGADLPSNTLHIPRVDWESIPPILKSADLLIMPYTTGTATHEVMSPLKMFEYMASGVPILSSDIGSVREVLSETCAYFFDPSSNQSAIEMIAHVAKSHDEAYKRAEQALRLVRTQFTWQQRAGIILEFVR